MDVVAERYTLGTSPELSVEVTTDGSVFIHVGCELVDFESFEHFVGFVSKHTDLPVGK